MVLEFDSTEASDGLRWTRVADGETTRARIPLRLGRYAVLEQIGAGGLGDVYAAYDPKLNRRVALKVLRELGRDDADLGDPTRRLLREAQAAAKLRHQNVITVHDVGTDDGRVFMSMEYLEGTTLSRWYRGKLRTWREIRDAMLQAGEGLAAAHEAGLVHRDFKPANVIMTSQGRVVVLDFGLSKAFHEHSSRPAAVHPTEDGSLLHDTMTKDGIILGTPQYMSWELLSGKPGTAASDQFAFCVTFFEALYGVRPYAGDSLDSHAANVREGKLVQPDKPRSVPGWLAQAVLRGLAPHPDDRWPSMLALLDALRVDQKRRRRAAVATVILIPLLSIGSAAAYVATRPGPTPAEIGATQQAVLEARAAAAAGFYVYPPPEDPSRTTAYAVVVELEGLEGPVQAQAARTAAELRSEMGEALVRLGDKYFERPGGPAFAADFYASALIFEPGNVRALERSVLRPSELAFLRTAAANGSFTPDELIAFEPLTVLADTDPQRQARRAKRLAASQRLSSTTRERFERVAYEPRQPDSAKVVDRVASAPSAKEPVREPEIPVDEPGPGPSQPAKSRVELEHGRAAFRAGQLEASAKHFHRALKHDPRSISALEGLTDVAFERGEYGEAVKFGSRAVKRSPKNSRLRIKLGDAFFKQLLYEKARAEYTAASKLGNKQARERLSRLDSITG